MARLIDSLVGHRKTLEPLFTAAAEDRLAATLIFAGTSGIGKRMSAMVLAQTLVCERSKTGACGECGPCLRMAKGQSESLLVVEASGAQIKIEQVRDVLQFIALRGLGRSRIIIIDQAHLLGPQGANALLKSLEEPPAGTYFILVTSHAASMLPTIRSRAQLVRFKPLADGELEKVLGAEADPWIIRSAHGSVEAARRLLEGREEYALLEEAAVAYLRAAHSRFPGEEISQLREMLKERTTHGFVAGLFQGVIRDALRVRGGIAPETSDDGLIEVAGLISAFQPRRLDELAQKAIEFEHDMARNVDRGLLLETFALELARS